MLSVVSLCVTPFQQNCRIIINQENNHSVVVDPGGELDRIVATLKERGLECKQIWLTHSHLDHCGAAGRLKDLCGAELLAHDSEKNLRASVVEAAELFGMPQGMMETCPEPDRYLLDGEEVDFDGYMFRVIHTPGHSRGSVCFYSPDLEAVFVGDVLFAGSIGRTDLPGGKFPALLESIKKIMSMLPASTKVFSGHGPDTSLEREKKSNPFLQGDVL